MSLTDFAVLEVLLHKGPMPVNTIGKKILPTSGSITTAVDRLEAKRSCGTADSASDRRLRVVSLTKEGTKQIKVAYSEHQKHLELAVSSLNKGRAAPTGRTIEKTGTGRRPIERVNCRYPVTGGIMKSTENSKLEKTQSRSVKGIITSIATRKERALQ